MSPEGTGAERQLDEGLAGLGLSLGEESRRLLLRYLALLQKWNRVYNLTAIRQPGGLVTHHLLDSLAVMPHLRGPSLVDVGTGAGLPGIPIAIARRDWQVFLLDSNHKKGAFLRQAVIELGLRNAEVATARAQEWRPQPLAAAAVSRAFSDLVGFVSVARDMVVPGGRLVAMKGIYPDEELAELPRDTQVESVIGLQIPRLRAARHLVLIRLPESPQP